MIRILLAHNQYQQSGGEDAVVAVETHLLRHFGHEVIEYTRDNSPVDGMNRLKLAITTVWSRDSYKEFKEVLRRTRPDVVHFHNTFVMISPSAYYAARSEGVPVVQTLHNYRLVCPNGLFFRDGKVCEDCLTKVVPWPGVVHACYRKSRAATGGVVAMLSVHRSLGTWTRMVDAYIALTEFSRTKFIQGGLPAERVIVKPNFVFPDPGHGEEQQRGYALFVGRLSPEKGLDTLFAAWEKMEQRVPLKIVGSGPLADMVSDVTRRLPWVEWLGPKSLDQVYALMRGAAFLVFPSSVYENLPRTIIESYAVGTPVIASDLGATSSVVKHNHTGLLFRPGDPDMLAAQVEWALDHPAELARMGGEARAEFESKYTAERNYQMLMQIYERVIGSTP